MRRNRFIIIAIIVLLLGFLVYPKFSSKHVVGDLVTNVDRFEEVIQTISVWEMKGDGTDTGILVVHREDAVYKELQSILEGWQVKRNFFGDVTEGEKTYRVVLTKEEQLFEPIDFVVEEDGILYMHGKQYKLVEGDIEELLDLAK